MKRNQFRLRTLVLLTAMLGIIFAASRCWPVTETHPWRNYPLVGPARLVEARPPTPGEWAVRAGISTAVLMTGGGVIGVWRAKPWSGKS